jgi:hypothetical protein
LAPPADTPEAACAWCERAGLPGAVRRCPDAAAAAADAEPPADVRVDGGGESPLKSPRKERSIAGAGALANEMRKGAGRRADCRWLSLRSVREGKVGADPTEGVEEKLCRNQARGENPQDES